MAVDRALLEKQMDEAQRRSGLFRYLKSGKTYRLRVLEYENADGKTAFAQERTEHRFKDKGGKDLGLCRSEMAGLPCPCCRINSIAADKGQDRPFQSRTRYVVNAVDMDSDDKNVRLWVVPKTVFEAVVNYCLEDDWADILSAKKGSCIKIKVSGSGLDTEYKVVAEREITPVDKKTAAQVMDPLEKIRVPSIEELCGVIGVEPSKIFTEEELEEMNDGDKDRNSKAEKPKSGGKKKDSNASEFEVDSVVRYKDEDDTCTIVEIDGDAGTAIIRDESDEEYDVKLSDLTFVARRRIQKQKNSSLIESADDDLELEPEIVPGVKVTVEIDGEDYQGEVTKVGKKGAFVEFEDGDKDWYAVEECVLVEDEEPEAEDEKEESDGDEEPQCFGKSDYYDENDEDCTGCSFFEPCGEKAGNKKNKGKAEKSSGKKSKKDKGGDDDVLADILG